MKRSTKIQRTSTVQKEVDAAMATGTTHTTPADGNIFLDLGFEPKEADALLKESDLRISKMIGSV